MILRMHDMGCDGEFWQEKSIAIKPDIFGRLNRHGPGSEPLIESLTGMPPQTPASLIMDKERTEHIRALHDPKKLGIISDLGDVIGRWRCRRAESIRDMGKMGQHFL